MVIIDATILMLFFRPDVKAPVKVRGVQIDFVRERIEFLIKTLEKAGEKIVVPTPVLSEILVQADAATSQEIIEKLGKYKVFSVEPFGARAAIELAAMTRGAIHRGSKKGDSKSPWAKLKFDRQIVAIAKVVGATTIYSDDEDVKKIAGNAGIPVEGLADLPIPDEAKQYHFKYEPENRPDEETPKDETDKAGGGKRQGHP